MKKSILTLVFLSLLGLMSYGQGNLQFNQVKLVSTQETVPSGHVWKVVGVAGQRVIEHDILASTGTTAPTSINPARTIIIINGTNIDVGLSNPSTGAGAGTGGATAVRSWSSLYVNTPTTFPLWLPAGTTLAASTNINFISVIEFVVNP